MQQRKKIKTIVYYSGDAGLQRSSELRRLGRQRQGTGGMRLRCWESGEGLEAIRRSGGLSVAAELACRRRSALGKKEKVDKMGNGAQGTKCTKKGLKSKRGM